METVNLAEAKAQLSRLVDKAAAGETVQITKRGKLVAQITAARPEKKPLDIEALRRLREGMTPQSESAGDFIRRMRDTDRY